MIHTFLEFQSQVEAAGLVARECRSDHWQIINDTVRVNLWPFSKRGPRFNVDAGDTPGKGQPCKSIDQLIKAAKTATPKRKKRKRKPKPVESPPHPGSPIRPGMEPEADDKVQRCEETLL